MLLYKNEALDCDLEEEIKTIDFEELKFENRNESELIFFVEILHDKEPEKWKKTIGYLINSSSTSVKFSIRALMDEIKPVAPEKIEFEYRKVSMTI